VLRFVIVYSQILMETHSYRLTCYIIATYIIL